MANTTGLKSYFQFKNVDWGSMMSATWETVWMTLLSMVAIVILGIILGLILYETRSKSGVGYRILNWIVGLLLTFSVNSIHHFDHSSVADYHEVGWNHYRTTGGAAITDHFRCAILCADG